MGPGWVGPRTRRARALAGPRRAACAKDPQSSSDESPRGRARPAKFEVEGPENAEDLRGPEPPRVAGPLAPAQTNIERPCVTAVSNERRPRSRRGAERSPTPRRRLWRPASAFRRRPGSDTSTATLTRISLTFAVEAGPKRRVLNPVHPLRRVPGPRRCKLVSRRNGFG